MKRFFLTLMAALTVSMPALAETPVIGAPKDKQLGFQEAASPSMQRITEFHDMMMWLVAGISIFVLLLLAYVILRFNEKANPEPSKTTHHVLLEVIWTLVPVLILAAIVVPSLKLLYFTDRVEKADMTLKVVGYQWYWGYEYPDQGDISFEAYMIPDEEIKEGQYRLLETDNRIILPVGKNVRLLITAADVIHSWAVPALGVKLDAVPGQTNETWVRIDKPGVYFGQCSELCGKDHAFMPIAIEAVSVEAFNKWATENGAPAETLLSLTDEVVEAAAEIAETATTEVTEITADVTEAVMAVEEAAEEVVAETTEAVAEIASETEEQADEAIETATDAVETAAETAQEVLENNNSVVAGE